MAHNRKNRSSKHNNAAPRGQADRSHQGGQWELNANVYEHTKTLAHLAEEENHIHSQDSKKKNNKKNEPQKG